MKSFNIIKTHLSYSKDKKLCVSGGILLEVAGKSNKK
jgi:hypothetical protein